MAKARKVRAVGAKKTWFPIVAPKSFNSQVVGEIFIAEPSSAVGRLVPVNLMNLTGDMRRQNVNIIFKINNVTGNKAYTETIGYEILTSSIKRLVKRAKNKVDYSFTAETADNYKVKIKVLMITIALTKLSTLTSLRNAAKENVRKTLSKMKYEDFVSELVNYKIQLTLKKQLSKVYPLRNCEIRSMRIMHRAKAPVEEKPKAKPKKEEKKSA